MTAEGVRAEPTRTAWPRGPGVPHAPGLDGLRGLAVLAVLAYHLDLAWASGGFLGVEVFFTLSGFLITQLLVADIRADRDRRRGAFLRARARRLLPALVTCVTATVVTYRLMLPADAPGLRWDALASLAYVQNWQLMLGGMPYSEAFARPSPLLHLWSLSVEGQLYVLWPLLFVGVLAAQRRASVVWSPSGSLSLSAVVLAVALYLRRWRADLLRDPGPRIRVPGRRRRWRWPGDRRPGRVRCRGWSTRRWTARASSRWSPWCLPSSRRRSSTRRCSTAGASCAPGSPPRW